MTAGDASTLRQVSLAALLGLDARALLATDDAATHIVYDKVIEQARVWRVEANAIGQHNTAVAIVNLLGEALGGRKA